GAKFDSGGRTIVFSRHAPPADAPSGVEFANDAIGPFVSRLREQPGKDIWLMGGGDLIASFLDEQAIDEFVVSVVPVFIGDGIPLTCRSGVRRASMTSSIAARSLTLFTSTVLFSPRVVASSVAPSSSVRCSQGHSNQAHRHKRSTWILDENRTAGRRSASSSW